MANPRPNRSLLADRSGDGIIADRQANVADAAVTTAALTATAPATLTAGTTALLTVTWTANDPGGTPDGIITITDGAVVAAAEMMEFLEEYEGNMVTLKALADELIADHATFKTLADELIVDHGTMVTDLGTMSTKINAIFDVLEEHGLMTES